MSDPIDVRVFRELVRELASEEPRPVDWDRAEASLFARLDAADADGPSRIAGFPQDGVSDELGDRISEVGLGIVSELDAADRISHLGDPGDAGDRTSSPYVAARVVESLNAIHHVPPIGSLTLVGRDSNASDEVSARKASEKKGATKELDVVSLEAGAKKSKSTSFGRWSMVTAFAAVAASIAFVLGGLVTSDHKGSVAARSSDVPEITAERLVDPADVPMAPGVSGAHDLTALRSGDMVEATSDSVSFARADSVTGAHTSWTISPGSRVVVRSGLDSPRQVLVLESGSIQADVPAMDGVVDPFVVEAGDTRVAVQGTIFSVTRSLKAIVVDVQTGFVVVGPRNELGLGSGRMLRASERGSFSLDGGLTFKALSNERTALLTPPSPDAPRDSDATRASTDAHPSNAPSAANAPRSNGAQNGATNDGAGVAALSPVPATPKPGDPVMTQASIKASLDRCFAQVEARRHDASKDGDVSLTMHSTLHLRIADDGAIQGAAFNPPLRSELQSCAVSLLSAHVDRGARTVDIPVEIRH